MRPDIVLLYKSTKDELYFNLIKEEYSSLIFNFASKVYKKAKYYNEDLEDCIQLCWMWFFKVVERYDGIKNNNFAGFLVVCLNNYSNNHIRDLYRHKEYLLNVSIDSYASDDESLTYSEIISSDGISPSYQFELNEALELFDTKKSLKDIEKMIFIKYLEGYSYKELSTHFSLNEKQIDNIVRKVKDSLKEI